jgi:hypothetical protein
MEKELRRPQVEKDVTLTVLVWFSFITLAIVSLVGYKAAFWEQLLLATIPATGAIAAIRRLDKLKVIDKAKQIQWDADSERRIRAKAETLGLSGNLALAQYILALEDRIEAIEDKQDK